MNNSRLAIATLCLSAIVSAAHSAHEQQQTAKQDPTILVDDDKVECPTPKFTTIQSAVDAAKPGDTIRVCAGTYVEQVSISKSLTIRG